MRSFEEAVRGADLVCCCTGASEPVIRFSWLAPGAHLTFDRSVELTRR
jgi:alanine dehydrogenase